VEALRDALAVGGLHVEFQPIVRRRPRALAPRPWSAGTIRPRPAGPDTFLPLAESAGLMPTLSPRCWTCRWTRRWRCAGSLADPGPVNLSPSDLLDAQLVR